MIRFILGLPPYQDKSIRMTPFRVMQKGHLEMEKYAKYRRLIA